MLMLGWVDHWLVLPDLLLPSRGAIPRQRKDQDQGHGMSFSQTFQPPPRCLPDCAQVTDIFPLSDYQGALDKMSSRGALKIAIKP